MIYLQSNITFIERAGQMKYNNNITLIEKATKQAKLPQNQYYALMVVDTVKHKDPRKFFNISEGWVGLECTSKDRIYISKSFQERRSPLRGDTWLVSVAKPELCYLLS